MTGARQRDGGTDAGLPPLREVIRRHGLGARKSLGQNFLLDINLTRRIARAAGDLPGSTVYEVGPGPGGLTRALLAQDARDIIAVEKDRRCLPALAELQAAYPGRLEVIEGDALKIDEAALFAGRGAVTAVGNLPYNIATALLAGWLETATWPPWFTGLILMFQKEVAQRIVARPGNKTRGRLSVLCQWRTDARILFDVPPRAFVPVPRVTSSLVRFDVRERPRGDAELGSLRAVLRAAFSQRRKMLRASLKSLIADPGGVLEAAGVDPEARAETLSVAQFCALARAFSDLKQTLRNDP